MVVVVLEDLSADYADSTDSNNRVEAEGSQGFLIFVICGPILDDSWLHL